MNSWPPFLGAWVISASGPDAATRAREAGVPDQFELPVDDIEVEDGPRAGGDRGVTPGRRRPIRRGLRGHRDPAPGPSPACS